MNAALKICILAVGMLVLDLPWLFLQGKWVQSFVEDIQGGRGLNPRYWAGIPVYLALGYLVTQAQSPARAFFLGLCTYAVYDFTQLFVFDKYPLEFALVDSLWGGLLMALTWWIANRVGLLK